MTIWYNLRTSRRPGRRAHYGMVIRGSRLVPPGVVSARMVVSAWVSFRLARALSSAVAMSQRYLESKRWAETSPGGTSLEPLSGHIAICCICRTVLLTIVNDKIPRHSRLKIAMCRVRFSENLPVPELQRELSLTSWEIRIDPHYVDQGLRDRNQLRLG